MKQVLAYTSPNRCFGAETAVLVRVQIDNAWRMGWRDLMLATNFPYQYNGVQATIVPDLWHPLDPLSNKIPVLAHLCREGLADDLYWYHDFDAYQAHRIGASALAMGHCDLGLTNYGWMRKWNCGSIFFRPSAGDLFARLSAKITELESLPHHPGDERVLTALTKRHEIDQQRYRLLNITYNFGMRHIAFNYAQAEKPIRVLHFHPWRRLIRQFMYGEDTGIDDLLMPQGLIEVFHEHGIR